MDTKLYQITPKGRSYIAQAQRTVSDYWDKGKYAPAQPRYRLGILESIAYKDSLFTRDEIVKRISEGLIDREREKQWPLRAVRLREAIAKQFEWLLANSHIKEV